MKIGYPLKASSDHFLFEDKELFHPFHSSHLCHLHHPHLQLYLGFLIYYYHRKASSYHFLF
nr:MAG TPA: hypothetical protein [Bacteriophage sp.]